MRRGWLVLFPIVLQAPRVDAAVFGRNRMHLVTPRFDARLEPETRANLKRTLSLGGGTAFLVAVKDGRGLVLTNKHVVDGSPGAPIRFFTGTQVLGQAPTGRVLSKSEELDYALVEVDLSRVPKARYGSPVKLRRGPVQPGEKVYKVGFPALELLTTPGYRNFDWTVKDEKLRYDRQPKRMVISVGHEVGGGQVRYFKDPDPRPGQQAPVPRYSIAIDDSSLPGNSGSPVFSARTHEVVGLHWAGGTSRPSTDPALRSGDRWDSANYAVPMERVLEHLRGEVASMPKDAQAQVQALIAQ